MDSPNVNETRQILETFLHGQAAHNPEQYETFLRYYEQQFYGPGKKKMVALSIDKAAYCKHTEVVIALGRLIASPDQTKRDFRDTFPVDVVEEEKDWAIQTLLRVALMIDCASKQTAPPGHMLGDYRPRSWADDQSLAEFAESCFPSPVHSPAMRARIRIALGQRNRMKAWKLRERYGVRFRPTDNLAEHLLFDSQHRTVKVFRQVGYLKAHLSRSLHEPVSTDFKSALKSGFMPTQLLLETLDSIQNLLYPNDEKSIQSLDKFVRKHRYDPDSRNFERSLRELPDDFEYKFWGGRLVELLDVVNNPPPTNRIVAWFERHSSERNALTVAILGLFLTVLFGFLGMPISFE
ncbi:hypothetical protein N0V90_009662 [Kalmusia sp. IMI 367209]|nr:hypothetical protein N0V90_009662 [Kalmusia sp. IMI 367209]